MTPKPAPIKSNRLDLSRLSWIAWRQISRKRRAGLSFMTTVSIMGIAIGVIALIVVLSVMAGFGNDLQRNMLKGKPHLEIMSKVAAAGFSLDRYPIEKWREKMPEAVGIEPFIQTDVILKQRKHLSAVTLVGVDPKLDHNLWGFSGSMIEGSMDGLDLLHRPRWRTGRNVPKWPGVVLGDGVASQINASVGDEVIMISPQSAVDAGSLLTGGTLSRYFVVVGIFRTGAQNLDSKWAVTDLDQARKFMIDYDYTLDEENFVSGIALNVQNPYEIEEVEARVTESELQPLSWKTSNKSLLFALKLERVTMSAILMLIVLVAAFSISGTMMMSVYYRRPQVALLRSLGMRRDDIARLFLVQGCGIGTVGIALGLGLGLLICWLIEILEFIELPEGIYVLQKLPVEYLPWSYVFICIAAWVLSLLAALYPAVTASRHRPVDGLR